MRRLILILFVASGKLLCAQESTSTKATDEKIYTPKPYFGLQVGSLGAGLQVSYPIDNRWNLRLGGTYLPTLKYSTSGTQEGLEVTTDMRFKTGSVSLISDFSLSKKKPGIKLSFGAIYQMTMAGATRSYYEPSYSLDVGTLDLEFKPGLPVNPYLGFSFGNFKKSKVVFFVFEVGAMYHGKPKVNSFTGEGRIAPTANESNSVIIENNIKSLQVYPYANMQLNFKINK